MKRKVIDASTLLAYLQGGARADVAGEYCKGSMMSAVSLAEVLQHPVARGQLPLVQAILHNVGIEVVPFDAIHAAATAELCQIAKGMKLSLADRACLSLGITAQRSVITGASGWVGLDLGVEIIFLQSR